MLCPLFYEGGGVVASDARQRVPGPVYKSVHLPPTDFDAVESFRVSFSHSHNFVAARKVVGTTSFQVYCVHVSRLRRRLSVEPPRRLLLRLLIAVPGRCERCARSQIDEATSWVVVCVTAMMYVCMYVCIVTHIARVWINRVRLPILLVVN